jgi:hypothetical protein
MSDTMVLELVLPNSTFSSLKQAAEQRKKTEAELAVEAIRAYLGQSAGTSPLLGLFADEPELVDRVAQEAMQSRESTPLRLSEVTGEQVAAGH